MSAFRHSLSIFSQRFRGAVLTILLPLGFGTWVMSLGKDIWDRSAAIAAPHGVHSAQAAVMVLTRDSVSYQVVLALVAGAVLIPLTIAIVRAIAIGVGTRENDLFFVAKLAAVMISGLALSAVAARIETGAAAKRVQGVYVTFSGAKTIAVTAIDSQHSRFSDVQTDRKMVMPSDEGRRLLRVLIPGAVFVSDQQAP